MSEYDRMASNKETSLLRGLRGIWETGVGGGARDWSYNSFSC